MRHHRLLFAAASFCVLAGAAQAEEAAAPSGKGSSKAPAQVDELVVTAEKLDAARTGIQTQLGASTYTITRQSIQAQPGADNTGLNSVILQAPGVTQDSFGQLHVRGDHNGLQYRLNGVILPEGLSVFGQTLSPKLADSVQLITGALPAEYGLRTAGVVDIKTRSGVQSGGSFGLYGGSHNTLQASADASGGTGRLNWFVNGSVLTNDLGIESPDGSRTPLHDRTKQGQVFGYLDYILDDTSRVSMLFGSVRQQYQIPNRRGLQPTLGLTVLGQTAFPSEELNSNQRQISHYGAVSYLKSVDKFDFQVSLFGRYSSLYYNPDKTGELLYNGIAQTAYKRDIAGGLQAEGVYRLNDDHTLRGGVIVQGDRATSDTTALVLPVDGGGAQTTDTPVGIVDNSRKTAWTYSVYVQDEWQIVPSLTLNYGVRFDQVDAYTDENQVSPRANLVWKPWSTTTFHAGYARYFTPAPFELVASETVAKFAGTTAAAQGTQNDPPKAERADYYDFGVAHKLTPALTVGLDTYYKKSKNLLDEGQFGAPIILTPFNYRDGIQYGIELSSSYVAGPLSAYANVAYSSARGRNIVSSQFNFDPGDLAYISTHYIHLDHEQKYSASAGVSYRLGQTRLSADAIYGSGLRKNGSVPNGGSLGPYTVVNLGVSHDFQMPTLGGISARLDVLTLFDKVYEIRDGTGVGVGAPQFGQRRGVFVGLTKTF